jgi:hypothetical protein
VCNSATSGGGVGPAEARRGQPRDRAGPRKRTGPAGEGHMR